jgi:hypothetical protein
MNVTLTIGRWAGNRLRPGIARARSRLESPGPPLTGRYGSEEIVFLREFVAAYRCHGRGRAAVVRYALRHPRELLRAISYVLRLPRLDVPLSASETGRAVLHGLRPRGGAIGGFRLVSAALMLPDDEAAYVRGKARQAVRTNVTAARGAGVTCRTVTGYDEQVAVLDRLADARGPSEPLEHVVESFAGKAPYEFFIAEAGDELISVCVMAVDDEAALITYHVSLPDHEQTSNGRWLLSLHLINECIRRGARMLLIETSPLDIEPGLEYFQRRLGFSVYNLRFS